MGNLLLFQIHVFLFVPSLYPVNKQNTIFKEQKLFYHNKIDFYMKIIFSHFRNNEEHGWPRWKSVKQGFQYCSSLLVLHFLQGYFSLKFEQFLSTYVCSCNTKLSSFYFLPLLEKSMLVCLCGSVILLKVTIKRPQSELILLLVEKHNIVL